MKEISTIKIFKKYSVLDLFGFLIFLAVPLTFFIFDIIGEYKVYYYALLAIFVAMYTLVGQFFFEKQSKLGDLGKKFISLAIINTLIISFINFTGNLLSPYYFVLYFLVFTVSIFTSTEILIFECIVTFLSVMFSESNKYMSMSVFFQSLNSQELANLVSIIVSLPLAVVISSFTKSLQRKQELLMLSQKLLTVRDIEDEAILGEVNQGIIVLDLNLTIVKISKWVETNFSQTSKLLLGKQITELELFDPITNKRLLVSDHFYRNLTTSSPKELVWRVLYKNQYGKFKKFIVKQVPLRADQKTVGFLLLVKYPPKTVDEIVSSFNQVFSFRISSSIAMIKNLISLSKYAKQDPVCPIVERHLNFIVQLLNDTAIKNDIADGNLDIDVKTFDLKKLTEQILSELDPTKKIAVWNVSPLYQTTITNINSDLYLCKKMIVYAIRGAFHLSSEGNLSLTFDEDENMKKPTITITTGSQFSEEMNLLEPFFAGKSIVTPKYKGTGLELSNSNLIANYLGFDFNAKISNNNLVIKITF